MRPEHRSAPGKNPAENPRHAPDFLTLGITLSRIPLAVLFAALLLGGEDWHSGAGALRFLACTAVLGLVEASDLLDGLVARSFNRASEWGAILDPYADSISRLLVFWSLAAADLALLATPLVMALRDITVAYARIVMMRRGRSVTARRSGKVKAVVQGGGAFLLLLGPRLVEGPWLMPAVSWLVILVTAVSAFEYVLAAARTSEGS